MLRNRSKAVTSKQALMADQIPLLSPTKNTPISSLISPRFFNGLLTNGHQDSEASLLSPKSILDTKNSPTSINPFGYDTHTLTLTKPQTISSCKKTEPEAIGLALIDSLDQENTIPNSPKPINRMALFGSNLKVKIPAAAAAAALEETPKSPADCGIKTKNSHPSGTPTREFSRQLSLKEMEQSEDYTCVITHGPNPKTTHIFDDCIVESCIVEDVVIFCDKKMACGFESISVSTCHSCKDSGEEVVCSHGCQSEEREFGGSSKSPETDEALSHCE